MGDCGKDVRSEARNRSVCNITEERTLMDAVKGSDQGLERPACLLRRTFLHESRIQKLVWIGRVLVGRSGGRLSNGHNGPSASCTGVPHMAHERYGA